MNHLRIATGIAIVTGVVASIGIAMAARATQCAEDRRESSTSQSIDDTNRLPNGGFEAPTLKSKSFQRFYAGEAVGPWIASNGSVDLVGRGLLGSTVQTQLMDLNGDRPGAISQIIATPPGGACVVKYSLTGKAQSLPELKTGKLLINGQNVQEFSFTTKGRGLPNFDKVVREATFIPTTAYTSVAFTSTTLGAEGPIVDNVSTLCAPQLRRP